MKLHELLFYLQGDTHLTIRIIGTRRKYIYNNVEDVFIERVLYETIKELCEMTVVAIKAIDYNKALITVSK